MTWQTATSLLSVLATIILGGAAYLRSKRADDVLDVAANVKTTFEAQTEINEGLRLDVARLRGALVDCEDAHVEDRRAISLAQDVVDAQAREIARLKVTVNEHEETIARHELTINQLRAGTSADRRDQ